MWWYDWAYKDRQFRLIYKLHGKYTKFQFKYGVLDSSLKGARGTIRIFGDNELLGEYTCELYDDAKSATLNIAGVNYLAIEFQSLVNNDSSKIYLAICDPLLIP
nr:NPCBM/NEW2 domain-containing protein [Caldicellulosiruptor morganii]